VNRQQKPLTIRWRACASIEGNTPMLTISKPLSAGGARDYFKREFSSDYYAQSETVGVWDGRVGRALGLSGEVEEAAFGLVMHGRHPQTGDALVSGSNAAAGRHRAGYDLTFSAPKSVSLQGLVGEDERILTAHRRAVGEALAVVEARARGRSRAAWGEETGNRLVARFGHETSRDLDPQLHSHCVVANLTRARDGSWRALESRTLYQMQALATAVYRAELAASLESSGYELDRDGRGGFEIRGISPAQLEHFSSRIKQRDAWLRSHGIEPYAATAAQKERAVRESRAAKRHLTRADLQEEWQARASGIGYDPGRLLAESRLRAAVIGLRTELEVDAASLRSQRAREAVSYALADFTEREAVFTRHDLEARSLARFVGLVTLTDVRAEIERRHHSADLIRLEGAHPHALTTKQMLRLERQTIAMMEAGRDAVEPLAVSPALSSEKGRKLSEDQRRAASALLQATDRVVGLQAPAGAGKTFTLEAVREEAEASGFRVVGLAPTTGAVEELGKSAIAARTIASFLQSGPENTGREVWIVDEAGLMSTRQAHAVMQRAEVAGARVIFVGDTKQHAGVEAGKPFSFLQGAEMRTAHLTELRRQRDETLKQAVELASRGKAAEAVRILQTYGEARDLTDERGRKIGRQEGSIVAIWDDRTRLETVVRDYVTLYDPKCPRETLMVAPSNAERLQLNALTRTRLRERGLIKGVDVVISTLRDRGVTGAARTNAGSYEVENVVFYSRGSKAYGLAKGATARVVAVDAAENLVTVACGDGRRVTYDPKRLRGVNLYQSEERPFAAGDRIQFRAPVRVGSNRAKGELHRLLARLEPRLGRDDRAGKAGGKIANPADERISNGALGTIGSIDQTGTARITLDSGKSYRLDLHAVRYVDHGYAVTSHSSQGKTTRNVLTVVDTKHSKLLVNRQQFYVSASRAKEQARIYTDSLTALPGAVRRSHEKTSAVEHVPRVEPKARAEQLEPAISLGLSCDV